VSGLVGGLILPAFRSSSLCAFRASYIGLLVRVRTTVLSVRLVYKH
jgi:hypothetical protein